MFRWLSLLTLFVAVPVHAEEPWKVYATRDGVTYERRDQPGSSFESYRATLTSPLDADRTLNVVWEVVGQGVSGSIKHHEVLSRSPNELLIYEQIAAPVVSDRDIVLRVRKLPVGADGVREVRFEATRDQGPPPTPHRVRLTAVRGAWRITPQPNGTSRLEYTCYSEPGGSVPAVLTRGAQRDQVVHDVQNVLRRLQTPGGAAGR